MDLTWRFNFDFNWAEVNWLLSPWQHGLPRESVWRPNEVMTAFWVFSHIWLQMSDFLFLVDLSDSPVLIFIYYAYYISEQLTQRPLETEEAFRKAGGC